MVPTESSAVRITRQRTSSRTRPKCSTGRALKRGSRYDAVSRGERSCGRSAGGCSSVRRPSSTAASSRAACASPTPGTRHKASRDDRVRRCSPPTAESRPLARSRAPRLRWPDPSTTATSSLSPSASAPTRTSFSRGRSAAASAFTPPLPSPDPRAPPTPAIYFLAMPRVRSIARPVAAMLVGAAVAGRLRRAADARDQPGAGRARRRPRRRRRGLRAGPSSRPPTPPSRRRTPPSPSATTARP